VLSIFVFLFAKAYYVWRNKQKDAVWNGMSEAERVAYVRESGVKGGRRADFRFAH
jgi:hypothetical protein